MMNARLAGLIFVIFALLAACSKENSTESKPTAGIVGSWKLSKFSMVMGSETETSTEEQLNEVGAVWDMTFTGDKNFEFVTNMVEGTLETYLGTWSTANRQLKMKFTSINGMSEIIYGYTVTNSLLTLTRSFPSEAGEVKTIAEFRKTE
jgi:hypothetical protein